MGACASRPSQRRGPALYEDGSVSTVTITRWQMHSGPVDNRSTADLITSAFLAQAEAEPEPAKSLAARLASRRGAEDRRASAQTAHLGIGPAPAAESRADLAEGPTTASMKKGTSACSAPLPVTAPEDSFEVSRAETVKRLAIMQKSFKGSGGPSPMWAFSTAVNSSDAPECGTRLVGAYIDEHTSGRCGGRAAGGRNSVGGGDNEAAGDGASELVRSGSVVEVLPLEESFGDEPEAPAGKATTAAVAPVAARTGAGAEEEMGLGEPVLGGGFEGSRRGEGYATTRHDEEPGNCFRTVSISRMQSIPKGAAAGAVGAGGEGGTAAACEGDGVAAAITDAHPETDELTSLPLPNLISVRGGAGARSSQPQWRAGHRYSASSYLQQAVVEPRVTPNGGAANRNSDLGYYMEEARFTAASPLQGALPVRHSLLDHPMMRQRAAQAAQEAETAARTPVVLDYVPSIRSQASRGNLMAQPSQKRLLPGGAGAGSGCGSAVSLGGDDDGDGGAAARRLEYVPKRPISRKSSFANLHSSSTLLGAGSASRPMSPVNSRLSLLGHHVADCLPSPPRTTGGDGSERCFHVTRAAAAAAAAAAGSSGGLPAAAASPLGPSRRRDASERRVSTSASQVHFGPTAALQPPLTPTPPAQRSTPSHEMSRRAQRSIKPTLEPCSSAPLLASPSSRLQMTSNSGATGCSGRRSALHEVLGGAAWTGPESAATPSTPLAAALSASGVPRAVASSDVARVDGGSAAAAYGMGSASRAAGRAARLLESLQRLGTATPEVAAVQ